MVLVVYFAQLRAEGCSCWRILQAPSGIKVHRASAAIAFATFGLARWLAQMRCCESQEPSRQTKAQTPQTSQFGIVRFFSGPDPKSFFAGGHLPSYAWLQCPGPGPRGMGCLGCLAALLKSTVPEGVSFPSGSTNSSGVWSASVTWTDSFEKSGVQVRGSGVCDMAKAIELHPRNWGRIVWNP